MTCPKCKSENVTWINERKEGKVIHYYRCGACGYEFTYQEGVLQK